MLQASPSPYEGSIDITLFPDGSLKTTPFTLESAPDPNVVPPDYEMVLSHLPEISEEVASKIPHYLGTDTGRVFEQTPRLTTKQRRNRCITLLAGTALLVTSYYLQDVQHGIRAYSLAQPSVSEVFSANPNATDPAAKDTILYDFPGLSGDDAQDYAAQETSLQDHGTLMAMHYGKTVEPGPLAEQQVTAAQAAGKNTIVEVGHSEGAINAIKTAAAIYQGDNNIQIPYIILDCPPFGLDSVRPEKLTYADYATWVLAHIPGIQYSGAANAIAQGIGSLADNPSAPFQRNIFENIIAAANEYMEVNSPNKASISLINLQYNAIVTQDLQASLNILGNTPGKVKPIIIIMQPKDPNADDTINSATALSEYEAAGEEAGLIVQGEAVEGIVHANPGYKPGEWNAGVEEKVYPAIFSIQTYQRILRVITQMQKIVRYYINHSPKKAVVPNEYLAGVASPPTPTVSPKPGG